MFRNYQTYKSDLGFPFVTFPRLLVAWPQALSRTYLNGVICTFQPNKKNGLTSEEGVFSAYFPLARLHLKALETRILAIKPSPYQTVLAKRLGE